MIQIDCLSCNMVVGHVKVLGTSDGTIHFGGPPVKFGEPVYYPEARKVVGGVICIYCLRRGERAEPK